MATITCSSPTTNCLPHCCYLVPEDIGLVFELHPHTNKASKLTRDFATPVDQRIDATSVSVVDNPPISHRRSDAEDPYRPARVPGERRLENGSEGENPSPFFASCHGHSWIRSQWCSRTIDSRTERFKMPCKWGLLTMVTSCRRHPCIVQRGDFQRIVRIIRTQFITTLRCVPEEKRNEKQDKEKRSWRNFTLTQLWRRFC